MVPTVKLRKRVRVITNTATATHYSGRISLLMAPGCLKDFRAAISYYDERTYEWLEPRIC